MPKRLADVPTWIGALAALIPLVALIAAAGALANRVDTLEAENKRRAAENIRIAADLAEVKAVTYATYSLLTGALP